MTKHPAETLTFKDLPTPVAGAASYSISSCPTGGYDVVMFDTDAVRSTIEHKPNQQAALRSAIRWQKRENAAVTKAAKATVKA